jgi:hypothetical protein
MSFVVLFGGGTLSGRFSETFDAGDPFGPATEPSFGLWGPQAHAIPECNYILVIQYHERNTKVEPFGTNLNFFKLFWRKWVYFCVRGPYAEKMSLCGSFFGLEITRRWVRPRLKTWSASSVTSLRR